MADNVVIYGLDELSGKIKRMRGELKTDLEKVTSRAVLYAHSQIPPYPPTREGQKYRRTGTLGREITAEVRTIGSETVGVIGSPTVYAPWVISDEAVGDRGPQAWMHEDRWWTLQDVLEKARPKILGLYRRWVKSWIK